MLNLNCFFQHHFQFHLDKMNSVQEMEAMGFSFTLTLWLLAKTDLFTPNTSSSKLPVTVLFIFFKIYFWLTFFAAAAPPNKQTKQSKDDFTFIHLVWTVCELTFSIIETHYKTGTLRHSDAVKDLRTLSPKAMRGTCCFRWCWGVLSWTVVLLELVSLVSCILPPLHRFCAATCHRRLRIRTHHIRRWLTFVKLRMQSRCSLVKTNFFDQSGLAVSFSPRNSLKYGVYGVSRERPYL